MQGLHVYIVHGAVVSHGRSTHNLHYLAASYRLGDGTKTAAPLATSPSHASGANVLSLTHACMQVTCAQTMWPCCAHVTCMHSLLTWVI